MNQQDPEDNFQVTRGFKSYVSKPEITDLAPNFLVKGSKNVLIDYANRVISRNGYTLYNAAAPAGSSGIKSSFDWDTSTAKSFTLRAWGQTLEFDWNGAWNSLVTGLPTPRLQFAKIWDNTEKIDVLLYVLGDTNTYKWSGGVTKIRDCPTPNITLRKQGVITDTSLTFTAGTPGTFAGTLADANNNFVNAGFNAGDTLYVTGSAGNSRNLTIGSVTAGLLTFIITDVVVSEASGPSLTIHSGEPTWASSRFLAAGTRKVTYLGVDYVYTGGESTDTLTGLTAFPVPALGDPVWQTVVVLANSGAIPASFKQNLIGVQLNQLILASTKSLEVYISNSPNYTLFTLTSPRAPGDPAKVNMDNFPTCIIPVDNSLQTVSTLMFGAGTSEFFKLSYQLSQDNTAELVRMIKLKSAIGSGLISGSAIGNIKNATAYITREPSLDTLGDVENVDGKTNTPISDPIKDDFDAYDFTDAHLKYWKRAIYIALPAQGIVLIYDLMRKLWQPPMTIPISRFSIIGDWLYGHSSVGAETYKLFTGTNDNGNYIAQVARFAYNNGGRRDRLKAMSSCFTDGYITPNGELVVNQRFEFNGAAGAKQMSILGSDTSITSPIDADPLGSAELGSDPLGGANSLGVTSSTLRFHQIDTMQMVDYFEQFTEFTMDTLDGQFAIVSFGSDQVDVGTSPVGYKK